MGSGVGVFVRLKKGSVPTVSLGVPLLVKVGGPMPMVKVCLSISVLGPSANLPSVEVGTAVTDLKTGASVKRSMGGFFGIELLPNFSLLGPREPPPEEGGREGGGGEEGEANISGEEADMVVECGGKRG